MAVRLKDGDDYVIGRVFTQTDVAELLNRQPQVIYRWHQRDISRPLSSTTTRAIAITPMPR